MDNNLNQRIPKFYGAVTLGERGQVVIPAEARRNLEIVPGTKLLVFGGHSGKELVFLKAEAAAEFIAVATAALSNFEQIVKTNPAGTSGEKSSDVNF